MHKHVFWRAHLIPLTLAVVSIICTLFDSTLTPLLRFDRDMIAAGEFWRVLTGHLTHLGWSHLGLNLAGLLLIWALFGRELTTTRWLQVLFISSVGVSAGLWFGHPNLDWYVGLSGVLHGLFIAGALASIQQGHRREWLLLGIMVGKVISEQFFGPSPGSEQLAGGPVIVDAHLYGALSGAVAALLFYVLDRRYGNRVS